jgi:hypothetical protein
MPSKKFKIVYTRNAAYGCLPVGDTYEVVEFTCADPVVAVEAYVNAVIHVSKTGWDSADVFPVVDEPKPIFTAKKDAAPVESKLFSGYTAPAKAPVASGPKSEKFVTPESTWISHVTWERFNSSIGVHFKRGGYRIYKSDYATFCNYKTWVGIGIGIGNSAGSYYNSNIKGLEVLKSKP